MSELFGNRVLQASVIAWASAQILKFVIDLLWRRKLNFRALTTMGGMPSSHSAAVSSLATGVAIVDGLGSTIFALALWFAAVTMYDAAGIRRAAMIQARILNQIIQGLLRGTLSRTLNCANSSDTPPSRSLSGCSWELR